MFARPIRWLVLLYGGRVVPFVIRRTELAQGPTVQDIRSGSNTYGHRFLTTSGRAGRAIKIKTFEDYEARLLENFVILDRSERESKIRRELETHARKLGGRVSGLVAAQSSLLQEVPDLVEYPSVVAGHFPVEFLQLPEEVLTTTMIHHQHYFPVVDDEGRLKPAFLAVTNMQPEKPEIIARNSERVLTARLRDARFFWDEDRKAPLESRARSAGDDPVPQEARQLPREGRARGGAGRVDRRARRCEQPAAAAHAEQAGLSVQGRPGHRHGARAHRAAGHDGRHLRPRGRPARGGLEGDLLPLPADRRGSRRAAVAPAARRGGGRRGRPCRWPTSSIRSSGMFAAGERPTGSRDPLGLRRQAQGAVKILADLPELTGLERALTLGPLLGAGRRAVRRSRRGARRRSSTFMADRLAYLLEQRGFDVRNVRAVMHGGSSRLSPLEARRKLEALAQMSRLRGAARRGDAAQAREEHHEGRGRAGIGRRAVGAR